MHIEIQLHAGFSLTSGYSLGSEVVDEHRVDNDILGDVPQLVVFLGLFYRKVSQKDMHHFVGNKYHSVHIGQLRKEVLVDEYLLYAICGGGRNLLRKFEIGTGRKSSDIRPFCHQGRQRQGYGIKIYLSYRHSSLSVGKSSLDICFCVGDEDADIFVAEIFAFLPVHTQNS